MHPVTQYALDVCEGRLRDIVGEIEIAACRRHLKDLKRQGTEEFPFVFDETRANRIYTIAQMCDRGDGQAMQLLPFQKFDLGCLFGWVHRKTGVRRFVYAYVQVGRGNAKTKLMGAVCSYGMVSDVIYPPGKPELARFAIEPEVVCAAVDREQARRLWRDAYSMMKSSTAIAKRLNIMKNSVTHKQYGGGMIAASKDIGNKDGGRPSIIVVDEFHAHKTADVKNTLFSGMGKREQCLGIIITTAGTDAENKPCYQEYKSACAGLREGNLPETYFAMIRQIDDADDPHDKTCWVKANPMFQHLEQEQYARSLYAQVEIEHELVVSTGDRGRTREWLIKRMNRWQAESEDKYMSGCMDKWNELAVSPQEFAELIEGQDAYVGLDLAKTTDLTGAAFAIPLADGRIAVTATGFMPDERMIQHEHSDRVPYRDWAREGWCVLTDGAVTDYHAIEPWMLDKAWGWGLVIQEVCYDSYNATHLAQDWEQKGRTMVEIRQGVQTLSEPTKRLRELILQGKIVHDGSPLLTWCLGNAVEVSDNNGNIKLSKKHKDDSQRIDPLAALINALVRAFVATDLGAYIMSDDWGL